MNQIISKLPLIWEAAEYFEKQCGSSWVLKSFFQRTFIWSAYSVLSANSFGDKRKELSATAKLCALRVWIDNLSNNGILLELDRSSVEKTLGVGREIDVHTEACSIARKHCMRARSATDFRRYYFNAVDTINEREEFKLNSVDKIVTLLGERKSVDPDTGEIISDLDRYDDRFVEREIDMLHETLAKVVESLDVECREQLKRTVSSTTRSRLMGHLDKIHEMARLVGVEPERIANRQIDLDAEIEDQMRILREGQ
jgi:hypothetical protein